MKKGRPGKCVRVATIVKFYLVLLGYIHSSSLFYNHGYSLPEPFVKGGGGSHSGRWHVKAAFSIKLEIEKPAPHLM